MIYLILANSHWNSFLPLGCSYQNLDCSLAGFTSSHFLGFPSIRHYSTFIDWCLVVRKEVRAREHDKKTPSLNNKLFRHFVCRQEFSFLPRVFSSGTNISSIAAWASTDFPQLVVNTNSNCHQCLVSTCYMDIFASIYQFLALWNTLWIKN